MKPACEAWDPDNKDGLLVWDCVEDEGTVDASVVNDSAKNPCHVFKLLNASSITFAAISRTFLIFWLFVAAAFIVLMAFWKYMVNVNGTREQYTRGTHTGKGKSDVWDANSRAR